MISVWYILAGIGAAIMLIVFVVTGGIPISEFQVTGVIILVLLVGGGGAAYYFIKNMNFSSPDNVDVFKAGEFVIKHANEKLGVDLVKLQEGGGGTARSFYGDPQTYFGFILRRSWNDKDYPNQLVSCVVGTRPLKVLEFLDNPSLYHMGNPFHSFAAGFSGAPSPKANPQGDAGVMKSQFEHQRKSGTSIMINPGSRSNDFFGEKKEE